MKGRKENNSVAEKKKLTRNDLILIIVASVLLVAIIVSVTLAIVSYVRKNNPIDFLNDNLDRYININAEDYHGYKIEINVPTPGDTQLQHEIITQLAKHKGALLNEGKYSTDETVDPGDKAYIWYTGYEIDKDGKRIDLAGTSNFGNSSADEITVGLSELVVGFDLSLVGKIPANYSTFKKTTSGSVAEGDVAYVTATYVLETGDYYENAPIRIDLRDPEIEAKWGVGIFDYLREDPIGFLRNDAVTLELEGSGEKITYIDIVVDYVTRCEENPLVIEVDFPYDYTEESFRNKHVYFDVYIEKTLDYETAVFDDAFITEKLKIEASALEDYEGATLVDKYKTMVMGDLLDEHEMNVRAEAEDAMWAHLREITKIKRLPEYEITRIYDNYYYGFQAGFTNYTDYYESLDAYICASLGIEDTADWKLHLQEMVETEVTEKLIFYYLMRKEGLTPEGDEFDRVYREELENDFYYYSGNRPDDYLTGEDYEKALAAYEKQIVEYYGQDKYNETVYYNYTTDKLIEMADLVNLGAK